VNNTPLGLSKNTWPLACSAPSITELSFPTTRFNVIALALGWLKSTVALLPTLKLPQSITARPVP